MNLRDQVHLAMLRRGAYWLDMSGRDVGSVFIFGGRYCFLSHLSTSIWNWQQLSKLLEVKGEVKKGKNGFKSHSKVTKFIFSHICSLSDRVPTGSDDKWRYLATGDYFLESSMELLELSSRCLAMKQTHFATYPGKFGWRFTLLTALLSVVWSYKIN